MSLQHVTGPPLEDTLDILTVKVILSPPNKYHKTFNLEKKFSNPPRKPALSAGNENRERTQSTAIPLGPGFPRRLPTRESKPGVSRMSSGDTRGKGIAVVLQWEET